MLPDLQGAPCRLCHSPTRWTHTSRLLGHVDVDYFVCEVCGFWCTEEPYWLEEAYSEALGALDTGLMARNLWVRDQLCGLLDHLPGSGPYVDWAGGYGVLVRLMRDEGFDFYWQDQYAPNLFARGFEWTPDNAPVVPASAVTAVEVLEHVPDPVAFLDLIVSETRTPTVIITQVLYPASRELDWWYFAVDGGQHISFYTHTTLQVLAQRLGMQVQAYRGLFLFTKHPVRLPVAGPFLERVRNRISKVARRRAHPTLKQSDHEFMIRKARES